MKDCTICVPVPFAVPPHETLYQCHIAPVPSVPPDNVIVEFEPEQTGDGEADTEAADVDKLFIVTVLDMQAVVLQIPSALT